MAELYARYEAFQKVRPGWRTVKCMLAPVVTLLGARAAASLSVPDWTAYRDGRPELAPSSRNYTLHVCKAMLRWAVTEGLVLAEPALCKAKTQPQKDRRETSPVESEIDRLLAEVRRPRERVIVLCAVDSGMRRNEIRQLQWQWIDREAMTIDLPNWACKNERGGAVPMTKRQLAAIDAMPHVLRSPYVLANPLTGQPYAREMLTKWWRDLATLAGLEAAPGEVRVRLHDGRHSFGRRAVKRGVRIEVVSQIMRHASLDQTLDYIGEADSADIGEAREAFERGIERDKRR